MAIRLARELRPDVIVIDMRMPDLSGPAAIRAILAEDESARIIAFDVTAEESDLADAIGAGACGYLMKDSPIADWVSAITAATTGAVWLAPPAARAVLELAGGARAQVRKAVPSALGLSPPEVQVLQLLALGLDNTDIADELSITPRSTKDHVSSILGKLGVRNRVEAAVYAARLGIV
jgi:DNA-binding NarL/FixJ family response regulator